MQHETSAASRTRPDTGARSPRRAWLGQAAREPLLQFLVLGGLIFAGDAALHPRDRGQRVIVVTQAQRQSMIDSFDEDKVRPPSEAELKGMIDNWVAGEILYREGKALGMDRGDDTIRDRIAFKLQLLIFNQLDNKLPADSELRAWFARNHARYDEPERVSYYISAPTTEANAKAQLALIQDGEEPPSLAQTTHAVLGRATASLPASYGDGFRERLLALPPKTWATVPSKEGWHVARLDSVKPGVTARLEDVHDTAVRALQSEDMRLRASAAVEKLKANYTVRYEEAP